MSDVPKLPLESRCQRTIVKALLRRLGGHVLLEADELSEAIEDRMKEHHGPGTVELWTGQRTYPIVETDTE